MQGRCGVGKDGMATSSSPRWWGELLGAHPKPRFGNMVIICGCGVVGVQVS
jgi:hypothetical protein